MTPEGKVKAHLKKRVAETGGELRFVKWLSRKGAPDCFIWWAGPIYAFVETKQIKGPLSGHQVREIGRLKLAGFNVYAPRCNEDVDAMIEELLK